MSAFVEPPKRWSHISKVTERMGPFVVDGFVASPQVLEMVREVRVLVIGAGGLGCELLKDLALMGFKNIDVIDMDTIDLSNLNRQFLFRTKDIGQPKALVAAKAIMERISGCNIIAHHKQIQDFDEDFYRQFQVIVCGLDSIVARRWINSMVYSLIQFNEETGDVEATVPLIDGGTEGFKGNARVILPGYGTPCIECTLDLFPPQVNYPLCTIAHTPRLPEHCIEYVKVLLWPKEQPFGDGVAIDGDDPNHLQWIFDKSLERAQEFNIEGVNYRLTQGVIKHIIPAVASTNAVIAAACATEAFKIVTSCAPHMKNNMIFNDTDGIYTYTYEAEKKDDCLVCSNVTKQLSLKPSDKLEDVIQVLIDDYHMREPGIVTITNEGKTKTLYMRNVKAIEELTRSNLKKSLQELSLSDGQQLIVADVTAVNSKTFTIKYN
ncbi:NEDD8-activating enzyme E1 catalytic subunit-like [Oppia nitens]|uniref:NEDD8-activating enzyme E1 catalytic subunit-like n=1 Tax=Oppia nitens TaxID=1686743 RepID=UPI0023DAD421|nr:NEDD8-activating enzyme E1 catalytic subunit-like [Oppia nitens]